MTRLLVIITLVSLTLWAYSPVREAAWVLEDSAWLPATVNAAPVLAFRGLTSWSWRWTVDPTEAHAVSLGLHMVISLLGGLLTYRLSRESVLSWVVGAFLLLNPIAVESTAYAASRSELIAALGVLTACLAATFRSGWKWPVIVLSFIVGMMGKESAVVILMLVPLTLWMTNQEYRYVLLAGGVFAVWTLGEFYGGSGFFNRGDYSNEVGAWDWLLLQSTATVRMAVSTLTGTGMTPDYDYDAIPQHIRLICLFALVGLADAVRQSPQLLRFAGVWFLLTIGPRLVVQTPTSYFNEHQFYIPRMGLLLGVAILVLECGRRLANRWAAHRFA